MIVAVMDKEHGCYALLHEDMEGGIATELVAAGIAKDRIVLGFYPPSVREMGEFAVA